MKPEDFGYVVKDGYCLFQKGPLSQWYGAFKGQESPIEVKESNFINFINEVSESGADIVKDDNPPKFLNFNCCEQFMMASKAILFKDRETFDAIMGEKHPEKQKDLGRKVKNYDQALWDKCKYDIVLGGNLIKFHQNEKLKEFLLTFPTNTIFAEAAPWDKVWGIGLGPDNPDSLDKSKWQGENLLGKVISEIRVDFSLEKCGYIV